MIVAQERVDEYHKRLDEFHRRNKDRLQQPSAAAIKASEQAQAMRQSATSQNKQNNNENNTNNNNNNNNNINNNANNDAPKKHMELELLGSEDDAPFEPTDEGLFGLDR